MEPCDTMSVNLYLNEFVEIMTAECRSATHAAHTNESFLPRPMKDESFDTSTCISNLPSSTAQRNIPM